MKCKLRMKEMKFRFWNLEDKCMVENVHNFHYDSVHDSYYYYKTWQDEEDGHRIMCDLMLYIGINDKNLKEIYDGDVLRRDIGSFNGAPPKYVYMEVKFESGCFIVCNDEYFEDSYETFVEIGVNDGNTIEEEIVGNIYQATEEEKKEWRIK